MLRTLLITLVLISPAIARADGYPVSGKWGQTTGSTKGPIDCTGKRVIAFNGETRTDSKGGVPAYRNRSVSGGNGRWQIVDIFTTGQISNGSTRYTLLQSDADHVTLDRDKGGAIKLQRCK